MQTGYVRLTGKSCESQPWGCFPETEVIHGFLPVLFVRLQNGISLNFLQNRLKIMESTSKIECDVIIEELEGAGRAIAVLK